MRSSSASLRDLHLESNPDFHGRQPRRTPMCCAGRRRGSYRRAVHCSAGPHSGWSGFAPAAMAGMVCARGCLCPAKLRNTDGLDFRRSPSPRRSGDQLAAGARRRRRSIGVRFGREFTLWSDLDALPCMRPSASTAQQFEALRHKAQRAGQPPPEQRPAPGGKRPCWPSRRAQGFGCADWLRAPLNEPHIGPTVVVTHFAPSLRSHDPRHGLRHWNGGVLQTRWTTCCPAPTRWLHGHLHCPSDWRGGNPPPLWTAQLPRGGNPRATGATQSRRCSGRIAASPYDGAFHLSHVGDFRTFRWLSMAAPSPKMLASPGHPRRISGADARVHGRDGSGGIPVVRRACAAPGKPAVDQYHADEADKGAQLRGQVSGAPRFCAPSLR